MHLVQLEVKVFKQHLMEYLLQALLEEEMVVQEEMVWRADMFLPCFITHSTSSAVVSFGFPVSMKVALLRKERSR